MVKLETLSLEIGPTHITRSIFNPYRLIDTFIRITKGMDWVMR